MSAKPTPGPWRLGVDHRGTQRVFADRHEIVRALSTHGARRVGVLERLANARLIAAAPDLLAALRELFEAVTDHRGEWAGAHYLSIQKVNGAIADARAAISKAEGEA